jgi:hypothetical protein
MVRAVVGVLQKSIAIPDGGLDRSFAEDKADNAGHPPRIPVSAPRGSGIGESMGAALVAPVVALIVLGLIAAFYFTRSASKGRQAEETLPDEPYARRQEEIRRLRTGHEESDPARVTHPARRP